MALDLPPELTDRIIDFLRDDRRALRSCALICLSWRRRSQFHLFHALSAICSSDLRRWTNVACDSRLKCYPQSLVINAFGGMVPVVPCLLADDSYMEDSVAKPFENTQAVHQNQYPNFASLVLQFTNLTTLRIHQCTLGPLALFQRFICEFFSLKYLDIEECSILDVVDNPVDSSIFAHHRPDMPMLTGLVLADLSCVDIKHLLDWLLSSPTAQSIRSVKIWDVDANSASLLESLHSLLRIAGPALEVLVLPTRSCESGTHIPLHIATGLRSICLLDASIRPEMLPATLSQLKSPVLEDLQIKFDVVRSHDMEKYHAIFRHIKDIFGQPHFAKLHKVTIWRSMMYGIDGTVSFDDFRAAINTQLPEMHALGILRIEHWDPSQVLW